MIEAILGLSSIALVAGLCLGLASKKFAVKVDPKVEKVGEELPGANCGGCGFASCQELAGAASQNPKEASRCLLITEDNLRKIGDILGCDLSLGEKKVAVIHCGGGDARTVNKYDYDGIRDCLAAALVWDGPKMCREGCFGFGTCALACPFEAISLNENHLPAVNVGKCAGCGSCAEACPRGIIEILPRSTKVHVRCHSHLRGAHLRKICKAGCIGCKRCQKACEPGAIQVINDIASIDYSKCTKCGRCALVCPTKCLSVLYSGYIAVPCCNATE